MDEEETARLRTEYFTAELARIKAEADAYYRNRPLVINWGPVAWWLTRSLFIYSVLGIMLIPQHVAAMIALDFAVTTFVVEAMPAWRITPASYWLENRRHNATYAGEADHG